MVGGGSANVFAALGSLGKKKKQSSASDTKVFWAPAPLNSKSWADVDDEDDDDYYATTAPPQPNGVTTPLQQSESEEESLDQVDDEEYDHEQDPQPEAEPQPQPENAQLVAPKDSERQLSKKELKKKELEELDAMLAEFGLKTEGQRGSQEKKIENLNEEVDKKENVAAGEGKSAKKKKKKDKSIKDAKEQQPNGNEVGNGVDEVVSSEKAEEVPAVDMKEKLKKVASSKKKKTNKEMDAAARAASSEAAARNARLAAAKKKEKSHYNQQPLR